MQVNAEHIPFSQFKNISQERVEQLSKKGLINSFPIQSLSWDPILEGKDVLGRARTGTGKTIAFCLPLIQRYFSHNVSPKLTILILEPTRELALQVRKEFDSLEPSLAISCFYGGTPVYGNISEIRRSRMQVLISTPGRLMDLLDKGVLDLSSLKCVVLDEADHMLDIGFKEDIERILTFIPAKRQTLLFSATIPQWVNDILHRYTTNVHTIDLVGQSTKTNTDVTHFYKRIPQSHSKLMSIESVISFHASNSRVIIFTKTKREASEIAFKLRANARALHGDIPQNQREITLQGFRNGDFDVLVATDVAARGLDIPAVDLVIQFNMPEDFGAYIHRSGRCGRAGRKGKAVLILGEDTHPQQLKELSKSIGAPIHQLEDTGAENLFVHSIESTFTRVNAVPDTNSLVFEPVAERIISQANTKQLAKMFALLTGYDALTPPSILTQQQGNIALKITHNDQSPLDLNDLHRFLHDKQLFHLSSVTPSESDQSIVFCDCSYDSVIHCLKLINSSPSFSASIAAMDETPTLKSKPPQSEGSFHPNQPQKRSIDKRNNNFHSGGGRSDRRDNHNHSDGNRFAGRSERRDNNNNNNYNNNFGSRNYDDHRTSSNDKRNNNFNSGGARSERRDNNNNNFDWGGRDHEKQNDKKKKISFQEWINQV